jgi:hypothetical protein
MHESMISHETWKYECLGCLHEWQKEFEVGRSSDGHGGEAVVYHHLSQRCTCPWAEPVCPSCGGYDVKILPTGWNVVAPIPRQRHTELEMIFRLRRLHAY